MTRFVVHALCSEGYAIVSAESTEQIERDTKPYVEMSEFTMWREFRSADLPISVVREVVESEIGDLEEYLLAIERANDVRNSADDLAVRWAAVGAVPFAGDDEYPSDDDEFTWEWGCGDPDLEVDTFYRSAMLSDLPDEIIEQFDLIEDTALDDYLGRVDSDDLEAVQEALGALGHTVE